MNEPNPPRLYRHCSWPEHFPVSHFEVPGSFVLSDYFANRDTVEVVQVMKSGARRPYPMNHRVVAECMGREQILRVGCWKPYEPK